MCVCTVISEQVSETVTINLLMTLSDAVFVFSSVRSIVSSTTNLQVRRFLMCVCGNSSATSFRSCYHCAAARIHTYVLCI